MIKYIGAEGNLDSLFNVKTADLDSFRTVFGDGFRGFGDPRPG